MEAMAMIRKGQIRNIGGVTSGLNAASLRAFSSWRPEPPSAQDHHAPPRSLQQNLAARLKERRVRESHQSK
jgi:hypothetical protein